MDRPTLSSYIRDNLNDSNAQNPGPFIALSRQFGCNGFEVADILAEKLNQNQENNQWKVYKREILQQVAEDAGLSEEIIEHERQTCPSIVRDFFKTVKGSKIPDSMEILKNITTLVRKIAYDGNAIIVGHGGTAATAEIENGLNVRIEAPRNWRKRNLARRDGLNPKDAEALIKETESGRKHLDKIYKKWNPRNPAFALVMDNSLFDDKQIVEHIMIAMKQKKLID